MGDGPFPWYAGAKEYLAGQLGHDSHVRPLPWPYPTPDGAMLTVEVGSGYGVFGSGTYRMLAEYPSPEAKAAADAEFAEVLRHLGDYLPFATGGEWSVAGGSGDGECCRDRDFRPYWKYTVEMRSR